LASHWCNQLPEYALVVESDNRRVVAWDKLTKDQRKVKPKDQGSVLRWMKNWTDGVENIPEERFKFQERFTKNGFHPVRISTFKSFQARYYGFNRIVEGKDTFFITAIDPSKKDNDADPAMLDRASKEAFRVLETLNVK
jgi:maltooligosyltrehalose synthase